MQLDHVTLRTSDLEGTREFLEGILGLKIGYRPSFGFPGYWLYNGDQPIVHLIPGDGSTAARNAEGIDHVAFRLDGYLKFREGLELKGIPYSTMDLPELGERRLFVRTPSGILMELVFREVAGLLPS